MTKRIVMVLVLVWAAFSFAPCKGVEDAEFRAALKRGADYRTVLKVVDDSGVSVEGASVRATIEQLHKIYTVRGTTDTNGLFTISGRTTGNRIVIDVTKDGYYGSRREHCLIAMGAEHEVRDGRWQPYGAEERMELRRIRHPADLVVKGIYIPVPMTNAWFGFNLEKATIVTSNAQDRADIEFWVDWDGLPPPQSRHCACFFRTVGDPSGGYNVEKVMESLQPYPYEASTNESYAVRSVHIVDRDENHEDGGGEVPFSPKSALVLRLRPKVDADGSLKEANYGLVRTLDVGPGWKGISKVYLSYIFNPTPNDTNLEAKR